MSKAAMNKITISIVIPTLNRPKHLKNALHSLLAQTRLPDEVIIVDQSDDSETEILTIKERPIFLTKKVSLKYVWEERKSLTHARNVGMHAAVGKIIFFLDDDMILDKHYISEILKVYDEHPNAVGVQGLWIGWPFWKGTSTMSMHVCMLNYVRKVFLLTHWHAGARTQKVLPSGGVVVPYPLTKTIEAEIIFSLGLSSFKKEVVKNFHFDENLTGYSWGEEWFTMKLNQWHPHSLYVTPFAKAIHDHASVGRPKDKQLYYIVTAYEMYNFSKNINPSLKNWIAFFWKCIGQIITLLPGLHHKEYRTRLFYTLQSYLWTMRHFGKVKTGKFSLT